MRFAERLKEEAFVEWASEYVDYEALKILIDKQQDLPEECQRAEFLFAFERQVDKVNSFYSKRQETIQRRLKLIESAMKSDGVDVLVDDFLGHRLFFSSVNDLPPVSICNDAAYPVVSGNPVMNNPMAMASTHSQSLTTATVTTEGLETSFVMVDRETILLEHVEECRIWVRKLAQYSELNWEGFRKILKKYDKNHSKSNPCLLEKYFERRVVQGTPLGHYRQDLHDFSLRLDACSNVLLAALTQPDSGQDGATSKTMTIEEIRRVWNDIYSLQVRSVLENDDAEALVSIARGINIESVTSTTPKEPNEEDLGVLSAKTLSLLEREHALLLKHLIEGICMYRSVRCMRVLISSGLNLCKAEVRLGFSFIGKVISFLSPITPLILSSDDAIGNQAAEMIRLLHDHGAAVNGVFDVRGHSLLHLAVLSGHLACVKQVFTLAQTHGNILNVFDNDGCSPLFYAIKAGNEPVTAFLMDRIQDSLSHDTAISISPQESVGKSASTNSIVALTETHAIDPLILACKNGHVGTVKKLLEYPFINVNARDRNGESCLHHCAKKDFPDCLRVLLENGADPECRDNDHLWTPLALAAARGHPRAIKVLLEFGAKKDSLDIDGWTPFEHAIYRGQNHLTSLLKSADVAAHLTDVSTLASPVKGTAPAEEPREYGHSYLGRKCCLRLSLGHLGGPRATATSYTKCRSQGGVIRLNDFDSDVDFKTYLGGTPAVELLDRPVNGPIQLTLRISSNNQTLTEPTYYSLPIKASPGSSELSFVLGDASEGLKYYKDDDEIRFDLILAKPTDGTLVETDKIIGRGVLLLRECIDVATMRALHTERSRFTIPVIDTISFNTVALVSCEVIVAAPFSHPSLIQKLSSQGKFYWKSLTNKVIGHRGVGANKNLVHPQVRENSVLSFVMAASLGTEYIEFDVQLTKDKVPVIYHDFRVSETGFDVPLTELTLEQFLNLKKEHHSPRPLELVEEGSGSISKDDSHVYETVNRRHPLTRSQSICTLPSSSSREQLLQVQFGEKSKKIIETAFATLEEVLKKVPKKAGFNIELKYPMEDEMIDEGLKFRFEINDFCDRILEVVCNHAGDRPIFFSSFHPDICLLLSLKQPLYPVFFLTDAGKNIYPNEPRASSLHQAVRFGRSANLLGLVSNSTPLVEAPKLITAIKSRGLLLLTYGSINNNIDAARLQRHYGVDGIIVDTVAKIQKGFSDSL